MVQYRDLPWRIIWSAGNPVDVLNEHLSLCWLDVIYQPRFDDQCSRAFGLMLEAHLRWTRDRSRVNWEEFVRCKVGANETYSYAKRQFSVRNRDVLTNVKSLHKWWSTSAVFCSSSSLPLHVGEGGGLVFESVCKAELLSDHFGIKQSRVPTVVPRCLMISSLTVDLCATPTTPNLMKPYHLKPNYTHDNLSVI